MERFEDLSKEELLRIMRAYDKYIIEFFDDEVHEGMIPVCIEEFYDNEYNYYLEVGDIICFGRFVDDEDLNEWLLKQSKENDIRSFEVTEIEDDRFYIKNCPYGILIDENWILKEKK